MITRIELTNFMSHVQTVIEPAAGLTVLVGPNNVGKSAVIAALQILARNENSTYVMRHGTKECSVKVETDDGQVIEWRRKKSPSYVINGHTFDRLRGGDLPEELHRALRLPPVDAAGDDDFDVHFGTQKSPIFLLDRPGSVAARFFASSSDAIRLLEIRKRHKEKHEAAKGEHRRLVAQSQQVNAQLDLLAPAVKLDDQLQTLEALHTHVLQFRERLDTARAETTAIAEQSEQLAVWQAHADVLAQLPPPPPLSPVTPLVELIAALQVAQRNVEQTAARVAVLAHIALPPSQHDVNTLERLATNLARDAAAVARGDAMQHALMPLVEPPSLSPTETLRQAVSHLERSVALQAAAISRSGALARLPLPPELGDEQDLRQRVFSLTTAEQQTASWTAQWELLHTVNPPPLPAETFSLAATVSQMDTALHDEQRGQDRLAEIAADFARVAQELRELAAGSQCRLCGSPLDPDRVLAHAAAGLGGHAHE